MALTARYLRKAKAVDRHRERIYVDASFRAPELGGDQGSSGIGVWMPSRGIAIAMKVDAKTSVEAELLALLAGAITAKRFNVERPLILSDCKSVVSNATRLLHLERISGLLPKFLRLAELADSHKAYGHVYNVLQRLDALLEWQPRENNREADLVSSIGSRVGNMGIILSGAKNRNDALNDILSMAPPQGTWTKARTRGLVRRRFRCGTRTVGVPTRRVPTSRTFLREAHGLIAKLSAEVA